jgi:hypothetical protein
MSLFTPEEELQIHVVRERLNLGYHIADYDVHGLLAIIDNLKRERDAYCKAKQENDERFMNERDEARHWQAAVEDTLKIAREQRDELAEALRKIEGEEAWQTMRHIASAALAKLGGGK